MIMHRMRTPELNKAQKIQQIKAKRERQKTLAWLCQTFPGAFDTESKIRPLKVGIADDILAHVAKLETVPFSKSKIREALVMFTRRMDYLTALKTKNVRVDLEGAEVAAVTDEESELANQKIKKHIEKTTRRRYNPARKSGGSGGSTGFRPKFKSYSNNRYGQPRNNANAPFVQNFNTRDYNDNRGNEGDFDNDGNGYSQQRQATPALVTVKRRGSKPYDEEAVARLK